MTRRCQATRDHLSSTLLLSGDIDAAMPLGQDPSTNLLSESQEREWNQFKLLVHRHHSLPDLQPAENVQTACQGGWGEGQAS